MTATSWRRGRSGTTANRLRRRENRRTQLRIGEGEWGLTREPPGETAREENAAESPQQRPGQWRPDTAARLAPRLRRAIEPTTSRGGGAPGCSPLSRTTD